MATIKGTAKKDKLTGTAVGDVMLGLGADDILAGGSGNDTLKGGVGNDWLKGQAGADKLFGEAGNDKLDGGLGNDRLDGGLGKDTLLGGAANDRLDGGAGDDTMNGGAGNDTFISSDGADIFIGGTGVDTVDYSAATSFVEINLDNSGPSDGSALGDTFAAADIENAFGSAFDDLLRGNTLGNLLVGLDGDDSIRGYQGADTLLGGNGDDFIRPGDDLDIDIVNGGDGNDTVSYFDSSSGVIVNLEAGTSAGHAAGDVYVSIENVTGSNNNDDILTVAHGGNADGNGGDDQLSGSTTIGTLTTEFLFGDDGADSFLVHYNTGFDVIQDFTPGTLFVAGDKLIFEDAEFANIQHLPDGSGASTALLNITSVGAIAANRNAPQLLFDQTSSYLYFDEDGTGTAFAPTVVAYLQGFHGALTHGGPLLSINEFEIV